MPATFTQKEIEQQTLGWLQTVQGMNTAVIHKLNIEIANMQRMVDSRAEENRIIRREYYRRGEGE